MLKIYTDASTKGNPGPSGAGLLIVGDSLHIQLSSALGVMSNHEAEFAAACLGLEYLIDENLNDQTVTLFTDSKVVAQTIDKNYTNNPAFIPYLKKLNSLFDFFPLIICQWIPEKKNRGADTLARQGLEKMIKEHKHDPNNSL